jgi:membrane associated rhomboid family serine protease
MLIPYRDLNPTKRFPVITLLLILANFAVFIYQVFGQTGFDVIVNQFGMIPLEIQNGQNLPDSGWINPYFTVISYMFLHGSLLHIIFNMLFLWIFGNNIEDRMTTIGFLIFYLLTGAISGLSFALTTPGMKAPLVGASGAISGILGAYLFMFPFARINALFFIFRVRMPAIIFIILWFISQILALFGSKINQSGIAWVAHISGFIAGIILFKFFTVKRRDIDKIKIKY